MPKVWVVGGSTGIGLAITNALRRKDIDVMPTGTVVDVREQDQLDYMANKVNPDMLVYSAGVNNLMWSEDMDVDSAANMYDVNVLGLARTLLACDSYDVKRVVVIGSDAAWRPMRASAAYCATKAALHQYVACVARERSSDDFAINVVAPGMTGPTGMSEKIDEQLPEVRGWDATHSAAYEKSQIPIGRRARPDEIAEVAVSVLLTSTPYMTGSVIAVNGGR